MGDYEFLDFYMFSNKETNLQVTLRKGHIKGNRVTTSYGQTTYTVLNKQFVLPSAQERSILFLFSLCDLFTELLMRSLPVDQHKLKFYNKNTRLLV